MNRRTKPRYKLILNMPDLVARHTKIGSSIFTVVFWAIFVYLWMPLITVVAWMFGFYRTYSEAIYTQEVSTFQHLALVYGLIILALGGSLLAWALQEYLRFRNVNRRREPVIVELAELAHYTKLEEHHIATWQNTRRLIAHHTPHGSVLHIDDAVAI